jgi:hypothetical protein
MKGGGAWTYLCWLNQPKWSSQGKGGDRMGGRKEETSKSIFGYYKTEVWDDEGRKAEGVGWTKEESIENAYKDWREKYK